MESFEITLAAATGLMWCKAAGNLVATCCRSAVASSVHLPQRTSHRTLPCLLTLLPATDNIVDIAALDQQIDLTAGQRARINDWHACLVLRGGGKVALLEV